MDNFSKLFSGLRVRREALEKAFYQQLDVSLIRSAIIHGTAARAWTNMGEGRHFQCFRQLSHGGLDLAILLAKPQFLPHELVLRKNWARDIRSLRPLKHPLLPPMEVLEDTQFLAYVQPCCETEQNLTPPLRQLLEDLHGSLANIGLELDDYPQLRSCQGHPFVIDYSELKSLPTKGFKL